MVYMWCVMATYWYGWFVDGPSRLCLYGCSHHGFFYWLWNNPVFEHAISLLIPKDHSHVEVSGLRTSYTTFPLCKALHMFFVRSKIDHRTLDIIIQLGNRTSKFIPFNGSFIWQLFTSQSMVESCSNGNSLMILK